MVGSLPYRDWIWGCVAWVPKMPGQHDPHHERYGQGVYQWFTPWPGKVRYHLVSYGTFLYEYSYVIYMGHLGVLYGQEQ